MRGVDGTLTIGPDSWHGILNLTSLGADFHYLKFFLRVKEHGLTQDVTRSRRVNRVLVEMITAKRFLTLVIIDRYIRCLCEIAKIRQKE